MIAELIDPAILGFILVGVMLICNICWFSNFIYTYISRICFWLFRFWKISILFNDPPILHGNDRTNSRRRSTLCIYGNNDGTSWLNGKIIFSFSINVIKS